MLDDIEIESSIVTASKTTSTRVTFERFDETAREWFMEDKEMFESIIVELSTKAPSAWLRCNVEFDTLAFSVPVEERFDELTFDLTIVVLKAWDEEMLLDAILELTIKERSTAEEFIEVCVAFEAETDEFSTVDLFRVESRTVLLLTELLTIRELFTTLFVTAADTMLELSMVAFIDGDDWMVELAILDPLTSELLTREYMTVLFSSVEFVSEEELTTVRTMVLFPIVLF